MYEVILAPTSKDWCELKGSVIVEPNKYFHGWPISKSPEDVAVKVVKDMLYVLAIKSKRGEKLRLLYKATLCVVIELNIDIPFS